MDEKCSHGYMPFDFWDLNFPSEEDPVVLPVRSSRFILLHSTPFERNSCTGTDHSTHRSVLLVAVSTETCSISSFQSKQPLQECHEIPERYHYATTHSYVSVL